jgi:polar amino acid transport system substrate-binding protein
MTKRTSITLLLLLGIVTAACGGDGGAETTTAPETTAAPTTTAAAPTTTAAPSDPCAKENLTLVSPGMLTIATGEPAFPPYVVDDDPTNKQGFESAVAYAIAEQLGFADSEVTWIRTGFDDAIAPGPKDFDFNLQQYSITEDRDEVVDFSAPYYVTNQALIAYAESPAIDAVSIADLKGLKLGAQIGTTSLAYIEDVIAPDTAASVFDTNVDAKSALDAGQVDAIVTDLPTAYYITAVEIPEASIVGVFEVSEDQADRFGLLLADGSPLKACLDTALEALAADGTLQALADEWMVQGSDLKTITP